jgi:hypothetical protein
MCLGHEMWKGETVGETHDIAKVGIDGCLDKTGEYCDGVKGAFRKVPVSQCLFSAGPMCSPSSLSPKAYDRCESSVLSSPCYTQSTLHQAEPCIPHNPSPPQTKEKVDSPVHPVRDI